ncbi:hypothetical protein [Methylobacterium haplocladii]|uniref:Uncharacterized protein n=1 Tax=Methylobacterium haplocladii TaxID=1176176 RepID=A0A512IQK8_9HYPH|nr:hypothetical protein [Methylobacterium haplocladii]GEO99979.1 hypothetical protein MHA02_23670 [Methylobacterium haplocladii]GJD84534.1 hypothetical protein HPGCJGGD_2411 [Methylobacterium haplocladii]GLS60471.1 hypothetical protein GCM10007887_31500 [Methylobacterium haplocladii]
MIDEPLALLAEAFGQDAEPPIPSHADGGMSAELADLTVIAAASSGQAERAVRSL